MTSIFRHWWHARQGAVSIEFSGVLTIIMLLSLGGVEISYCFFQWNQAQQAVKHGARLAATNAPVAFGLQDLDDLAATVPAGSPLPDYSYNCHANTQSCDKGAFNTTAMNAIFYGPDQDGVCAPTDRYRKGMCDIFSDIDTGELYITYQASGLGKAGSPPQPQPLVEVRLSEASYKLGVLSLLLPEASIKMPDVYATVLAEDMRTGI